MVGELQPDGWAVITDNFIQYINSDFSFPIKATIDDNIVGLGNLVIFPGSAWLTHIIVAPEHQGEGIGSTIVDRLLEHAQQANIPSVALMASEMGEPIYAKAGFKVIGEYSEFKKLRENEPLPGNTSILPYSPSYRRHILKLDEIITGENREDLLSPYLENSMVFMKEEKITGYHIPFLGEGPIYALDVEAGISLMELHYSLTNKAVVPSQNADAIAYLKKQGFEHVGLNGKRMVWGADIAWNPSQVFGRINGAYG
nr:GNAT family N-acetyltransferase [Sphingobacterium sp. lm-10]